MSILDSLQVLHKAGRVHRDLKPENVLKIKGKWLLGDFGLVSDSSDSLTKFTATFSIYGSRAYMAPEQCRNFHKATALSDIYAFGCILHDVFASDEELQNRLPFHQHTTSAPFGSIIESCTAVSTNDRYSRIKDIRDALNQARRRGAMTRKKEEWLKFLNETDSAVSGDDASELKSYILSLSVDEKLELLREFELTAISRLVESSTPSANDVLLEYVLNGDSLPEAFAAADRVTRKLLVIVSRSKKPALAALAVVAIAKVASSNNRYYAMDKLRECCAKSIGDGMAGRIAEEIRRQGAQAKFLDCYRNGKTPEAHPMIADVLGLDSTD